MFDYRQLDDPQQILPIATSAFALRLAEQSSADTWLNDSVRDGRELFGVYEEDRLLSGYMLYDYRMRLRKSVIPMGGIGLLCSRLDARGKGAVRRMIGGCLKTMQEKGQVVSVLDPFDESFYRNYGWEKFSRLQCVEFSPGLLAVPEEVGQDIVATDLSYPDEASMAFYNDYAATHYTLAQRHHPEWHSRTRLLSWAQDTAARGVVRFNHGEHVVGLMGYDIRRKTGEYHSTFAVNLLAYRTETTLRAMLRYIRRLSHQVSAVHLELPMDAHIWPYLANRPAKNEIRDMFMIRIVSMADLDGLGIEAPDLTLGIEVEDPLAPWNEGAWTLGIDSGRLAVAQGGTPAIRCGIGPLSSVLSGFSSFAEMIAAGKAEALESYRGQDLPKTTPFLADYF